MRAELRARGNEKDRGMGFKTTTIQKGPEIEHEGTAIMHSCNLQVLGSVSELSLERENCKPKLYIRLSIIPLSITESLIVGWNPSEAEENRATVTRRW